MEPFPRFQNRHDAGQQLAQQLTPYAAQKPVVIGLPRGGVIVAVAIATQLQAPLEICLVRKLGLPTNPELAMGAIAEPNICLLDHALIRAQQLLPSQVQAVIAQEKQRLQQRTLIYEPFRPHISLRNRCLIVVDDGIATGASLRVALIAMQKQTPSQLIVAVPVVCSDQHWQQRLAPDLSAQITLVTLETFQDLPAISYAYLDFAQVNDQEVCQALAQANPRPYEQSLQISPGSY
jgi:putative phosphoribosyl transferase